MARTRSGQNSQTLLFLACTASENIPFPEFNVMRPATLFPINNTLSDSVYFPGWSRSLCEALLRQVMCTNEQKKKTYLYMYKKKNVNNSFQCGAIVGFCWFPHYSSWMADIKRSSFKQTSLWNEHQDLYYWLFFLNIKLKAQQGLKNKKLLLN